MDKGKERRKNAWFETSDLWGVLMTLVGKLAWMYVQAIANPFFALGMVVLLLLPGILPLSDWGIIWWYVGVMCFLGLWIVPGTLLRLGPEDLDRLISQDNHTSKERQT